MSSSESNAITGRPTRTIIPVRRLINEPIASQPRRRRGGAAARAPRSGGGVIRGPQARATRSRAVMSAAQLAAATATINNVNQILRESKGTPIICLMGFFALVHLGLGSNFPSSVANSRHSMRSWMDGPTLMHEIDTNDFLAMHEYFFTKEMLPEIRKKMRTVKGRAELLKIMWGKLFPSGTVRHVTDSTFQHGNDTSVQMALFEAATRNNSRLCLFNEDITMQHMNNPRLLTRPAEDGGAPVANATNWKKNKAYAKSVKPGFYVGDDLDIEDKLVQNEVYAEVGAVFKTTEVWRDLKALRERWEALPQGGKHAVDDIINGHRVTYK